MDSLSWWGSICKLLFSQIQFNAIQCNAVQLQGCLNGFAALAPALLLVVLLALLTFCGSCSSVGTIEFPPKMRSLVSAAQPNLSKTCVEATNKYSGDSF